MTFRVQDLNRTAAAEGGEKGQSLTLFLSLFLLLLAFFILLNAMSDKHEGKSNEVLESVKQAFPAEIAVKISEGLLSDDGSAGLGTEARREIGEVFGTIIPGVNPDIDPNGNPLRIEVPTQALFADGDEAGTKLSRASGQLARDLAGVIAVRSRDFHINVEILTGMSGNSSDADGRDAEFDRLGALARLMVRSGVPDTMVSIGLNGRDTDTISWLIYLKDNKTGIRGVETGTTGGTNDG